MNGKGPKCAKTDYDSAWQENTTHLNRVRGHTNVVM